MIRKIIPTLLFAFIYHLGFAQDLDKEKLDRYFDSLAHYNKFMGTVAVSKNSQLFYTKSVGFADIENQIKADVNTRYRVGSISKTFTAVLILKAVELNKIDLNQTIYPYFPEIKNSKKITLSHLLQHRSGIHNFTDDSTYFRWNTQPKTEKEMIALIAQGGSDFKPDSKSSYSNSNFLLLTYILEKTFSKSYQELLLEYIVRPLGLKNTSFGDKTEAEKACPSYRFLGQWTIEPLTDASILQGAGGVVSTPGDLIQFSDALFSGKIISRESVEKMKTLKDKYGMGLLQFPFNEKTCYGHTGVVDGFRSMFTYIQDGNLSYAYCSNGLNTNSNDISIAVLSACFGLSFEIPSFKTYAISADSLDQYLGVYASKQIPLKLTITKEGSQLMAQATGQSAFPLEANGKDSFAFEAAGVQIEFNVAEHTLLLKQGGGVYMFKKE